MKILSVVGARPQFIKSVMVSRAIKRYNQTTDKLINEILVHTGQHYDYNLSDIFFRDLEISNPDYHLGVGSGSHGMQLARILESLEKVLIVEDPQVVLVYGDTNSTLGGSLSAAKLNIPVAHIEAGLRSYNMEMPEEINRILTDRISTFLFCPTDIAVENLNREGFGNYDCNIIKSGDVMYDTALFYKKIALRRSNIISELNLVEDFVLCTIHRQENTNDISRLRSILCALNEINQFVPVVMPLHPRTQKVIDENKIRIDFDYLDPVSYLDMLRLLENALLIITDSGGLQKEAYFFKKYCITVRDETEWVELVNHGFNNVVGTETGNIVEAFQRLRKTDTISNVELYGNGKASELIVKELQSFF